MLIVIGFFVASVLMAMDLNSFNKFFDVFVPIYSVAAVFFIAYSVRKGKQPTAEESNGRIYTFKKKNKLDALNWKQRFAGVWEKIERKGIYEVRTNSCSKAKLCITFVRSLCYLVELLPSLLMLSVIVIMVR